MPSLFEWFDFSTFWKWMKFTFFRTGHTQWRPIAVVVMRFCIHISSVIDQQFCNFYFMEKEICLIRMLLLAQMFSTNEIAHYSSGRLQSISRSQGMKNHTVQCNVMESYHFLCLRHWHSLPFQLTFRWLFCVHEKSLQKKSEQKNAEIKSFEKFWRKIIQVHHSVMVLLPSHSVHSPETI